MRIAALFLLFLFCTACAATNNQTGGRQVTDGAVVQLQPHTAYLLVRTKVGKNSSPVDILFVRTLNPDELQAAMLLRQTNSGTAQEPNVFTLWSDDPYVEVNGERIYLMAVKPGTYIIGGQSYGSMMGTCMCLGTVKFEAKEGQITDLGYVMNARDDKPIDIPELSGYGRDVNPGIALMSMTVLPPSPSMEVPEALRQLPRVDADYHAYGSFPNYFATTIDRMAPVVGVFDYDKDGKMIDLKAQPVSAAAASTGPTAARAQ